MEKHKCYICQKMYICGFCNNPKIKTKHCQPPENFKICSSKCLNEYIKYYTIHRL